MTTVSDIELTAVVEGASWFPIKDRANITTAVAIALAESKGNPKAVSSTGDYGLWQINKKAHPDLFEHHPQWSRPAENVQMAHLVYRDAKGGNNFTPWVTYNNGAYKAYLPRAQKAYDTLIKTNPNGVTPGVDYNADPGAAVAGVLSEEDAAKLNSATNFLNPANWFSWIANALVNSGVFILALVLFIVGIWLLIPKGSRPKLPAVIPV